MSLKHEALDFEDPIESQRLGGGAYQKVTNAERERERRRNNLLTLAILDTSNLFPQIRTGLNRQLLICKYRKNSYSVLNVGNVSFFAIYFYKNIQNVWFRLKVANFSL